MVFVSLWKLELNHLNPVAQCSFSLTYVGHDFRLLSDIGRKVSVCMRPFLR